MRMKRLVSSFLVGATILGMGTLSFADEIDTLSQQEQQTKNTISYSTFRRGYVTADALKVRTGPGLNYPAIAQWENGELLGIFSEARDSNGTLWYQVINGWVCASYIRLE